MTPISRGFRGRRQPEGVAGKLPPGQYETRDFPVLSAGPTPRTPLSVWDLTLRSPDGQSARWTWDEFVALNDTLVSKGQPLAGEVGVKLWNLKLGVGKSLSQEAARVFASEMPDGHKVVPDDTVLAALDRLKVPHKIMRSEKTPYLLLGSDTLKFQKPTRPEVVDLQ